MSVSTGGRFRGILGRWLMRIQAIQGIVQMASMAITAASTLTFALQSIGYTHLAPWVLGAGLVGTPVFAYVYVDMGLFNRKNRENVDRGNNFATPRDKIDDTLIGTAVFAAVHGREPDADEQEVIEAAVTEKWSDFRNGVEVDG
jgi:hypothetical protein